MTAGRSGWTSKEILAEVKRRGSSIAQLAAAHGMHRNQLSSSLYSRDRKPRYHGIIAEFIGRERHELWPHFYEPSGYVDRRTLPQVSEAALAAALAKVEQGLSVRQACASTEGVCQFTLYRQAKIRPDVGARLSSARGLRQGLRLTQDRIDQAAPKVLSALRLGGLTGALQIIPRTTFDRLRARSISFRRECEPFLLRRPAGNRTGNEGRESFVRALRQDELFALAEAALPRGLPPEGRDDVRSDLIVALLTGEVRPDSARQAALRLASAWHAMFSRRDLSMEQEMDGGSLTFGGLIADPNSYVPANARQLGATF
jgi:lambda repressor-like predicted transcriptional regulator